MTTTQATRPPTALALKAAYDGGDHKARETAPLLRERRMAWRVADAFEDELTHRGSMLRLRLRAERDYLEGHLRKHRFEMPARVVDEFDAAITALCSGVDVLDDAARARRRAR